jgi:hypothetical protein
MAHLQWTWLQLGELRGKWEDLVRQTMATNHTGESKEAIVSDSTDTPSTTSSSDTTSTTASAPTPETTTIATTTVIDDMEMDMWLSDKRYIEQSKVDEQRNEHVRKDVVERAKLETDKSISENVSRIRESNERIGKLIVDMSLSQSMNTTTTTTTTATKSKPRKKKQKITIT